MNTIGSLRANPRMREIAFLLTVATLVWFVGISFLASPADASQLTNISDTLDDSAPSVATIHTIDWTASSSITSLETIRFTFDPLAQSFNLAAVASSSITATGMTKVNAVGDCNAATDEVYINRIDTTADYIELRVCSGDTVVGPGAKQVVIGSTLLNSIINPASTGSYVVRIGGTQTDNGDTRVAIVPVVQMHAAVDTAFTFTIAGVASSTNVNGVDVSTTTVATPNYIGFGTLSVGTSSSAAQRLNVTTNAAYGFVVTVELDQRLTSSNSADIDLFANDSQLAVPGPWTAPTGVLGNETTYGHLGVTSEDATLTAGDEFGTALYAGNLLAPREVFMHNGPADGNTANIGSTTVAYRVQITALQEAANDYSARVIYVATPTF